MAKILVFQHVPYEPLGTLDPLIRSQRHRIRYVNFGREPDAIPIIEGYDALIILGGPMNIGEELDYPHLEIEKKLIRDAISKNMAILGICLGAQLIASALGAGVFESNEKEIGWYPMHKTAIGQDDRLIRNFGAVEEVFQWHSFTFELPDEAELLVEGENLRNQAYRVGDRVYGFQFHLEASEALIYRWLNLPQHLSELGLDKAEGKVESIKQKTTEQIDRSLLLSYQVFSAFLSLLPRVNEQYRFAHRDF